MIGDGQAAALVSRDGSIDWLCWPRFDSDACLAALLGTEANGCWSLAPEDRTAQSSRAYCGDTLVLETEFTTTSGRVRLTDFMPMGDGEGSSVIRIVSGLDGVVAMQSQLKLRFDYGSIAPWFSEKQGTITGKVGPDLVVVRSSVQLEHSDKAVSARFELRAGQRATFTLQHAASTASPPGPLDAERLLAETKTWWLEWIGKFDRPTDWPDLVKRSLLTLKALTYFPTGGVIAAPTTSLPEKPGGRMNWDYRFCWLRDSTFTMTAFLNAGLKEEAESWLHWLLHAVAGSPDRIRIAYRVDGGGGWKSGKPTGCRGSAGRVRCGSAMKRLASGSSTYSAKSWIRLTLRIGLV